jgi:hypothetical protein
MLPNVRGLIPTADGASILFEFRGRTIFEGDEPGRQNLVGWFESDHEGYRWLNDLVLHRRGRDLGGAGYDDQRLRRHSRDVGAAQPPFSAPACPARAQRFMAANRAYIGPVGVRGVEVVRVVSLG